jgi:hypothetical protein
VTATFDTREAWLIAAARALGEPLAAVGEDLPEVRVSVGFPGGSSNRKVTVGQCWASSQSADGISQIFISPIRGEEETVNVLATLLHELIHAINDCVDGHKGEFARIAKAVGFVPKLTSSDNRTDELTATLTEIGERIGPFPHPTLAQGGRGSESPKPQTNRQLKIVCPDTECGYTARTTRKWIEIGLPICPCGEQMEEAA